MFKSEKDVAAPNGPGICHSIALFMERVKSRLDTSIWLGIKKQLFPTGFLVYFYTICTCHMAVAKSLDK